MHDTISSPAEPPAAGSLRPGRIGLRRRLKLLKSTLVPIYRGRPYMSHLWVTRRCNIHCRFCYIRDYSSPDPSLKEIRKRLDKIGELGCRLAVIMGGEPTLRKDLPEIIGRCNEKGILSYLVTNGTLLNRKMADRLGDAGLDVISVSLDTLNPGENPLVDYGRHAFDPEEKLELLRYCQDRHGMVVFVAICITKLNMNEAIPITELARKHSLAVTLTAMADPYIIPDAKDRAWKAEKDSVLFRTGPEISGLRRLMKELNGMKASGYRIIEPNSYFERVGRFPEDKERNPCKAGRSFFDINTDGRIMLCVMGEPVDIHYSELNRDNFIPRLSPFREKQLKDCRDRCLLAAYYDTGYYAEHLLEFFRVLKEIG